MTTRGRRRRHLPWKWIGAGLAAIALAGAWYLLPLEEWIRGLQREVAAMGIWGGIAFVLAYTVASLLLVPGALLTVAAGVVFGLGWGTLVASVASTLTAAAGFMIAHLARARVAKVARRHPKFMAVDQAVRAKGWKVVALLRLSPVVPFSLSNYLFGLTAVRFGPYLLASWLAMLPGTLLYVWIGAAGGFAKGRRPWEWALLGAGLAATAVLTVVLTRAARRELARSEKWGKR